ncbi:MAG: putative zinc-binding metallopeptidase [Planctomycetota bacterium]
MDVRIEHTWTADVLDELRANLDRRGVSFRPHTWVSNDWFTPQGVPGFAIPFYLLHPRLARLERKQMLEVDGGTRESCLKNMRHECGHAIQNAYRLNRRRAWQKLFGRSSAPYPQGYQPNPASRNHVQHLRLYYAQSHPDEDFAETFAVWLQPPSIWRRRYKGWPVMKKLEWVDEVMAEIADAPAPVRNRRHVDSLKTLEQTLGAYYEAKRRHYAPGESVPDVYSADLKRLFSDDPRHARRELASAFLRRNRRDIRELVAYWTGEYQFTLDHVLDDMIARSRELKLRAVGAERKLRMDSAMLLTVRTIHFLYSRRNWIPL